MVDESKERPGSQRLADKLRSMRGPMTQAEAARVGRVSFATWENIERREVLPKPATLQRIAEGFEIDVRDLYECLSDTPLYERFSDEELDRLAERLAPLIARRLERLLDTGQ